jgi:hypothetical protein
LLHFLLVYLEINLLYGAELHDTEMNGMYEGAIVEQFKKMFSHGFSLILLFPIYQLLKILLISLIINTGFSFYKIEFSFKRIIWIVSICEFILLIPFAYKIFYFSFLHPEDYLRIHFMNFSFGSLLDVVQAESLEKALFFVLQAINIWDLFYFILAGYLIKKYHTISYDYAYQIVFNSYGLSYVAFIVFGYLFLAS